MTNWILINDFGQEYLINLDFIKSISLVIDCRKQKYLLLETNHDRFYQWSFQNDEECENKYKELIKKLTGE